MLQFTNRTSSSKSRRPHGLAGLADRVFGRPIAILPQKMDAILSVLGPRLGLAEVPLLAVYEPDDDDDDDDELHVDELGIARIAIRGTLVRRASGLNPASGMVSYERLTQQVQKAADDNQVRGLVFDFDSPGGECDGLFPLADLIYGLRGAKPMLAAIDSSACSAAAALAAAVGPTFISDVGVSGSIGVFTLFCDQSEADKKAGLKFEYLQSGKRKTEFNPHAPLDNSARASMLQEVSRIRDLLVGRVARFRGVSPEAVYATEAGCSYGMFSIPLFADRLGGCDDAVESMAANLPALPMISVPPPSTSPALSAGRVRLSLPAPAASVADIGGWLAQHSNLKPTAELMGVATRLQAEAPALAKQYGTAEPRVVAFSGTRASVASTGNRITMLVAPWNSASVDLGGYREVYQPGCFDFVSLDPRCNNAHSEAMILGRRGAGTCEFWEDATGLWASCTPPDATWAGDLIASLKRGDVRESSAGFFILQARWEIKNGQKYRIVERAGLREAAVVAWGAYPESSAFVESPASAQLAPAASAMRGANDLDRAWLQLLQVADGPAATADLEEKRLAMAKLDWRPWG